jgi:signal transduction histidine kinase
MTAYLCWLAALASATRETRVTISVREGEDAIAFEVTGIASGSDADLDRVRDRVEALGGQLTIRSGRDGRTRAAVSLPLS